MSEAHDPQNNNGATLRDAVVAGFLPIVEPASDLQAAIRELRAAE